MKRRAARRAPQRRVYRANRKRRRKSGRRKAKSRRRTYRANRARPRRAKRKARKRRRYRRNQGGPFAALTKRGAFGTIAALAGGAIISTIGAPMLATALPVQALKDPKMRPLVMLGVGGIASFALSMTKATRPFSGQLMIGSAVAALLEAVRVYNLIPGFSGYRDYVQMSDYVQLSGYGTPAQVAAGEFGNMGTPAQVEAGSFGHTPEALSAAATFGPTF